MHREAYEERVEEEERPLANTFSRPGTVVVEVVHANLALVAVPRFVRSYDVAPPAAVHVGSRVFLPCFSIHDARVRTRRRRERDQCGTSRKHGTVPRRPVVLSNKNDKCRRRY